MSTNVPDTDTIMAHLPEETRLMLEELAELDRAPLRAVLAEAVKEYWGRRIIDASNDAYRTLRADPHAWREVQEERALWDATLP